MNCGLKAYRAEVVEGMQLYGELHRYIPVLAHYRGYRVTELPVNHRPREHGRSNYGVERYVRGFLDLLTVTFMGRYRHRPLHLFGGVGLLFSLLGTAILVYLTIVKLLGHAIGQRPLLLLGVLLVVVGIQLLSLGLISELITSHHEERTGASGPGGAPRGRSAPLGAASMRVLYFGTYDRAYPRNAQVISALRGAGVEVREQHRAVWERRHNWSVGLRQMLRVAEAERSLRRSRDDAQDADALIVGYPGHFDLPAAKRVARGGPSSSIRSCPSTTRSSTTAAASTAARPRAGVVRGVDRRAFRRADLVVADTEAHAGSSARSSASRRSAWRSASSAPRTASSCPGWQPEAPFHALFVGKLIPLHGLETILAAAALAPEIPFRVVGSGQLEPLLDGRPANVEWLPWVEYESLPGEIQAAGLRARDLRHDAEGRPRDPEQGVPGARLRDAARHRRHARPRASCSTDGRDALLVPAGRPGRARGGVRRLAGDRALADRIGAAGRETYEARASEDVLGARWRALLERAIAARDAAAAPALDRRRARSRPGCRRSPCSSSERSRRAASTSATSPRRSGRRRTAASSR